MIALETDTAVLFHADAVDALRQLPDNSVDALVTDPPAGIGFLGKAWDHDKGGRAQWIAWLSGIAAEVLRVLKPGAHGFVWAIPRTSHWAATAFEDAGFEIRDVVHHLFGTGFPKSVSMDKQIDKAQDKAAKLECARVVQRWFQSACAATGVTKRQIDQACGTSDMACHWVDHPTQPEIPHEEHWPTLCGLLGEPPPEVEAVVLAYLTTRREPGADWQAREVTGTHNLAPAAARAWRDREPGATGERKDKPHSAKAAAWEGWGTALKPAAEHWIMVRKPLAGTLAENIEHGTGALNLAAVKERNFPANVTISEEVAAELGDRAKFFYTAKPTTKERDLGCESLPVKNSGELVNREEGSAGINNPRAGAGRTSKRRNSHPTVKPVALMEWLIKLITPPDGTVLDPFAGSGTTGVAALGLGFNFIGVEKDAEYLPIVSARLLHSIDQRIAAEESGSLEPGQ